MVIFPPSPATLTSYGHWCQCSEQLRVAVWFCYVTPSLPHFSCLCSRYFLQNFVPICSGYLFLSLLPHPDGGTVQAFVLRTERQSGTRTGRLYEPPLPTGAVWANGRLRGRLVCGNWSSTLEISHDCFFLHSLLCTSLHCTPSSSLHEKLVYADPMSAGTWRPDGSFVIFLSTSSGCRDKLFGLRSRVWCLCGVLKKASAACTVI
jgi:hypothetical protein